MRRSSWFAAASLLALAACSRAVVDYRLVTPIVGEYATPRGHFLTAGALKAGTVARLRQAVERDRVALLGIARQNFPTASLERVVFQAAGQLADGRWLLRYYLPESRPEYYAGCRADLVFERGRLVALYLNRLLLER